MILILILIIASLSPAAALASDAGAAPEHGKAATADASPVDPGATEVELAWTPSFTHRAAARGFEEAAAAHAHGLAATVTRGALPGVDVKLSAGLAAVYDAGYQGDDGASPRRGTGATDATVGARWRFLHLPERSLELAVTGDLVLPVGERPTAREVGLTQDFWSARAALVATKDLGALTANAELAFGAPVSGDAGGLRSVLQANAAVGWQLLPWLQPELELNYGHAAAVGPDARVLAVTAGVLAPFGAGHRVVAAVQQGLWGASAAQTTAGVLSFKTAL